MIELHTLPPLAKTAYQLTANEFQRALTVIGQQAVAALGLKEEDNWSVDFDKGIVSRDVPDKEA